MLRNHRHVAVWIGLVAIHIFLISSCNNSSTPLEKTYHSDGSLKEKIELIQNDAGEPIRHGEYLSYFKSGRIEEKGQYITGKKQGEWTIWYDSDPPLKRMSGEFLDGEMHGRWSYWMPPEHAMHAEHSMQSDSNMPQMNMSKAADGSPPPSKQAEYAHGRPHGLSISWYPSGQVSDSMRYVDGQLQGALVSFHPNGRKSFGAIYDSGKLQGEMRWWDSTGQPIVSQ